MHNKLSPTPEPGGVSQPKPTVIFAGDYRVRDVTPDKASGSVRVIRNHWWWLLDGDPKQGIFYVGTGWRTCWSPQCNSDKRIMETLKPPFGGAQLTFLPVAFVPERESR